MDSRFVPTGRSIALWSAFVLYSAAVLGWTHIDGVDFEKPAGIPPVEVSVAADGQLPVTVELSEHHADGAAIGVCEPGLLFPLPSLVTAKLDDRRITLPAAR